jgi:DNA helicase-2/ATP-dependent DNA helicase PcrA
MPSPNRVILASAGSGKTTWIAGEAESLSPAKTHLVTYTLNGVQELSDSVCATNGVVPECVRVESWFSFLIKHFVRPYQRSLNVEHTDGLFFVSGQSVPYTKEVDVLRHYFSPSQLIYSDKVSKFACKVIDETNGLPLRRFEKICKHLFIDECQDLAAWDLNLLEHLFSSEVQVILVGDIRQSTYATNNASKNSRFKGSGVIEKLLEWERQGKCAIEYQSHSHRCRPEICAFADRLYPDLPVTESKNHLDSGHDGVYVISTAEIDEYFKRFAPKVLRYDRRTKVSLGDPSNFGAVKGMSFERVMIFPHGPLKEFLTSGKIDDLKASIPKVYVAVTRARQSVVIVVGDVGKVTELPTFNI